MAYCFCPEHYKASTDYKHCINICNALWNFLQNSYTFFHHRKYTMIQPPYNKCPVCPMPQPCTEKYNKFINTCAYFSFSVTTKRDIQVLLKPCRQRDMPSVPEFFYACSTIWIPEILLETKTIHFSKTNSHITVSAEIIINLQHICYCPNPC